MTHHFSSGETTHRLLSTAAALLLSISIVGCGGSPLASTPLSPSALPSSGLALQTSDVTAATDGWGTLGKGNGKDNGNGKDGDNAGDEKGKAGKGEDDSPVAALSPTGEVEGVVATATGACPTKTVTIGTETFTTNEFTVYKHGTCEELVALASVEVKVTTQTDGSLLATRVKFEGTDEDEEEGEEESDDEGGNPHDGPGPFHGTVSAFRGVCPTVTFNLKGMKIVTSATTTYAGGTCETLRPNVQVLVTGTRVGETRTINATDIEITRTH